MAFRSLYDVSGQASLRGEKAEDKFEDILKIRYPDNDIVRATRQQDMQEHWDFSVFINGRWIKYDSKGARKIQVSDNQVQDDWFVVEFLNVNGKSGWVLGKADWIAFETLSDWILVKRQDLLEMSINKIKESAANEGIKVNSLYEIVRTLDLRVTKSRDALYRIYRRKDRMDAITWVKKKDILSLPHEIWQ